MPIAWRYEPIDVARFPLGKNPFRARGLAYDAAFRYIDGRLPGGRSAFMNALGKGDPFAAYYDQLFLVAADYDVSPLLHLLSIVSTLEGTPTSAFIQERSRWSGARDLQGLWRRSLQGPTAGEVAKRLAFAFERYFPPCTGTVLVSLADRCEGEIGRVPACMNGLYVDATIGFYIGAVEASGGKNVTVSFERPRADGVHEGVAVERLRFVARWSDAGAPTAS